MFFADYSSVPTSPKKIPIKFYRAVESSPTGEFINSGFNAARSLTHLS